MVGKSVGQRSNVQRMYAVIRPLIICTAPKRMWFIRLGAQARGCGRISPAEAPHCRFGGDRRAGPKAGLQRRAAALVRERNSVDALRGLGLPQRRSSGCGGWPQGW